MHVHCYNVWIDNVVTDAGGKKVVKLVAGNGRKVRDIHVSNVKAIGSGWAIEIEGDWASARPTVEEMCNLSFDNIEGHSDGLVLITSNCSNVSLTRMSSPDRIVKDMPNLIIELQKKIDHVQETIP